VSMRDYTANTGLVFVAVTWVFGLHAWAFGGYTARSETRSQISSAMLPKQPLYVVLGDRRHQPRILERLCCLHAYEGGIS
jgi:hypothetical protein